MYKKKKTSHKGFFYKVSYSQCGRFESGEIFGIGHGYEPIKSSNSILRRVLDIYCQIDSSQCLAQLIPARVGKARSVHVQLGGITTCHKMRHGLSLPTVTYVCTGELPHFHHIPTTSFLHSQMHSQVKIWIVIPSITKTTTNVSMFKSAIK